METRSQVNSLVVTILKQFENFKPWVLTLLDRYKVSFYHQQIKETWGCLVSKDGQQRRKPFRVKLKQLNKLTSIKLTSIKGWAYDSSSRDGIEFANVVHLIPDSHVFCAEMAPEQSPIVVS